MTYHFKVYEEDHGFFGQCREMDNVFSEGDTIEELEQNLSDALQGIMETALEHNLPLTLPDTKLDGDMNLLKIRVNADLAFSLFLKKYRIDNRKTQDAMKDALGMRNRNTYVKLETRGNPTIKTLQKIVKVFPDFPVTECL